MHHLVNRLSLAACTLVFAFANAAHADNWPQWRGPTYDGVSTETNLPTHWSATESIVWKFPMPGMGGSTPAVWGDRIFATSEAAPDVVLLCISTEGKELWRRKIGTAASKVRGDEGNNASPSPSVDGTHVYAFAGTGDLCCFDFDGKEVWRFNVQDRYGKFRIQFGMHTTPLLFGNHLYLQLLHSAGTWVIALDKANGNEVWKVKRESDARRECEHSYASLTLWHNGRNAYLICHGNDYATAHRLEDGGEIWRVGDLNPKDHYNETLRFVASPAVGPDLIVVPSAKNGPVVGVKPDATGLIATGSSQEQWRRPKNTPDVPSPLVHDGLVYLFRENGVLICMDAKTGRELYQEPLLRERTRCRASPVYADGKIYLAARNGAVIVVKAGPTFEKLAVNQLPDQFAASPAISNGRVYLRGFDALYAIGPGLK